MVTKLETTGMRRIKHLCDHLFEVLQFTHDYIIKLQSEFSWCWREFSSKGIHQLEKIRMFFKTLT